jgi:hypothetical protein
MKKINPYMVVTLVIFIVGLLLLGNYARNKKAPESSGLDPKNTSYVINGEEVSLVNGISSIEAAPGSASKITTEYFGNEARRDLNSDGVEDVAFLLSQETGGSGLFYYVAAALGTGTGYKGTNALLIGDRIAPQTTEINNKQIIVNYAGRASGEPMTASPSIGFSKYFEVKEGELVLVK